MALVGRRIRQWRLHEGLDADTFAARLGCSKEHLQALEAHQVAADGLVLSALSRSGVSMAWVLAGQGPVAEADRLAAASLAIEQTKALPVVARIIESEGAAAAQWIRRMEAAKTLPPAEVQPFLNALVGLMEREPRHPDTHSQAVKTASPPDRAL